MFNSIEDILQHYIDNAFEIAETESISKGVDLFFTLRGLLKTLKINENDALQMLNKQRSQYQNEAKRFYHDILQSNKKKNISDIFIVGDSLHLPRPAETKQANNGIQFTPSYTLLNMVKTDNLNYNIKTWAQRYFTTSYLLNIWERIIPTDLSNTHLVIHLGLNDHVERIFLEEERLALSLCSPALTQRIVKFGQTYRRYIISKQLNHSYVPYHQFQKNIQNIISKAQKSNAKSITFVNIIASDIDSWKKTPRSIWNTTKYNMFLYDMEQQHDIKILDLDRLVWETGLHNNLLADKIHLSQSGHQILADEIVKIVKIVKGKK